MVRQKHEPVRQCVACRTRAAARQLVRFVAVDRDVRPDRERRLPGRGAHVCPEARCLDAAARRLLLYRGLRLRPPDAVVRLSPAERVAALMAALEDRPPEAGSGA